MLLSFRIPPVPSVFEDSPVYQPASQPLERALSNPENDPPLPARKGPPARSPQVTEACGPNGHYTKGGTPGDLTFIKGPAGAKPVRIQFEN